MPSNAAIIEMVEVAVSALHEPRLVAEHVNWTVNQGDYWVIGGLQGSGKSDLLAAAASLIPPASGVCRLFGQAMPIFDETRLPTRLRLGLVFENGQLLNHLTVRENIALPLRYHHNLGVAQGQAQVQKLIEAMELDPWADSLPGNLTRNWQKRVGLARALTLAPEILLVDNPLSGLDLRQVNWWLNCLEQLAKGDPRLAKQPVTLVVTTSDLRPWEGRARQFAILHEQHFTVLGNWSEVQSTGAELVQELMTVSRGPNEAE